jgi:Fe-Mn family superoxide dismutase
MDTLEIPKTAHVLPALPYDYAALEPHIDAQTMKLHHDMHHATYVKNLNAALEKYPELRARSAVWLLLNIDAIPEAGRTAIRNNAGGHVNHSMFWQIMSPDGDSEPAGLLADAIKRDFGSVKDFKTQFEQTGEKLFGSGWVWLANTEKDGGTLKIFTTSGHDNPLVEGHFPLLVNDVWEHAYYLKYQNRRGDYLKDWWSIVNWKEVARRFGNTDLSPEQRWESDGAPVLAKTA